uniref:Uncharacterized protein n=1 Tax=Salix viminalis TaxID=40686 RepID=A0A6N2MH74_SALVM
MNKRSGQLRWSVSETGNPKILERDGNGDNIIALCIFACLCHKLDRHLIWTITHRLTFMVSYESMRWPSCLRTRIPQYPYLPIFESNVVSWMLPFSDETRDVKRIKRSSSMVESLRSNNEIIHGFIRKDILQLKYGIAMVWPEIECPFRPFSLFLSISPVKKLAAAMINAEEGGNEEEGNIADGMRSVQLLIACAEAVACRDKITCLGLIIGAPIQCFGSVGFVAPTMNIMDIASDKKEEEALRLVYEICPHIRCGHFVANNAILEAFEGESSVHVVDLGMTLGLTHGHQWRLLIQSLAEHAGKPPSRLRITDSNFGDELEEYAKDMGINLEFSVVKSSLENLRPEDIETKEIKNVVSCEGPARVERHERVDQWRRTMSRAGFQAAPIKMMAQAKQWLGEESGL